MNSVDILNFLYEQFPVNEELAVTYAKGTVNLTAKQTKEDCTKSVRHLKLLYEKFPTNESIAVDYAGGLTNLSFRQAEEVEVQKNTQQVRKLFLEYPRNVEIQFLYAEALFILTLKQKTEVSHQTVAQLREFLWAYPGANQKFQRALGTYTKEHPDCAERYTSLKL